MANHPNRTGYAEYRNPEPTEVKAARERAGLSIEQAAALIYTSVANWTSWELQRGIGGRRMHPAFWHLFRIRVGADLPKWASLDVNARVRMKLPQDDRTWLPIDSDGYAVTTLFDLMCGDNAAGVKWGDLVNASPQIELLKEKP